MEVLILALILFIGWHFLPDREPERAAPKFKRQARVTTSTADWQARFEAQCESPAEVAFLRAMIKEFNLKPSGGSLAGTDIRLDLQVEEGRYRVDFLCNEWLVVEIDGAQWHSSDEAIARDRMRDGYLDSLGYTVIRIPAKLVFEGPAHAVLSVRNAIAIGKKDVIPSAKKTGFQKLAETGSAIAEIANEVKMTSALKVTLDQAREAIRQEDLLIDAAIRFAEIQNNPILRKQIEEFELSISHIKDAKKDGQRDKKIIHSKFPGHPEITSSAEWNAFIEASWIEVCSERDAVYERTRSRVTANPRLESAVLEALMSFGRSDIVEKLGFRASLK